MPWPRRVLATLTLASAALWFTTAAASAQSVGLPNVPKSPVSPPKVDHPAETVKQAVSPVVQTAKQRASSDSQSVSSAMHAAKSVTTSLSAAVPTAQSVPAPPSLPVSLPNAAAPVQEVVDPVVHEAVEPVVSEAKPIVSSMVQEVATAAPAVPPATDAARPVIAHDEAPATTTEPEPVIAPVRVVHIVAPRTPVEVVSEEEEPQITEEQPDTAGGAESVIPIDDAVVAIHDREIVPGATPEARSASTLDVEKWPALETQETSAAPAANVETTTNLETASMSSSPEANTERTVPPLAPREPQPRSEPQSVGTSSVGLSVSSGADFVTNLSSISPRGFWTRLITVGRKLPSVIVLPNLAPPG